ncbi:MAG: ATP-binding protein, partial [Cyclobacteriaceae bacterium]
MRLLLKRWSGFVGSLLLTFGTYSITQGQQGSYFIENHPPNSYISENFTTSPQVLDFCQDERGVIYMANVTGILSYDGRKVQMVKGSENLDIISLAKGLDGSIYAGGTRDLGHLIVAENGEMQWHSLLASLPEEHRAFQSIKSTNVVGSDIYFQSKQQLFRWDGQNFNFWESKSEFTGSFSVEDAFYIQQKDLGLFRLDQDLLELVIPEDDLNGSTIEAIIATDNQLLLFTEQNGIYRYDFEGLEEVKNDLSNLIRSAQIKDAIKLDNGKFMVASNQFGVAVTDQELNVLEIINKENGLLSNVGGTIFQDQESGIWIGLDQGFSRVEYPLMLSNFNESDGLEGPPLSILNLNDTIYVASHTGLYVLQPPGSRFERVQFQIDQPWNLKRFGDKVLVAAFSGVYELDGKDAQRLWNVQAKVIYHSKKYPSRFYIGLTDGLASMRWEQNEWIWEGRINGLDHLVERVAEDRNGKLWASCFEVSRIDFSTNFSLTPQIEKFTSEQGFIEDLGVLEVSEIDDRILFGTSRGIHYFNETESRLVVDTRYGEWFADSTRYVYALSNDDQGNIWLTSNSRVSADRKNGKIAKSEDGTFNFDSTPLKRIPPTDIWTIYPDPQGIVWLGTNDGLYRYDQQVRKNYSAPFNTLIRSIKLQGDSTIFHGAFPAENGLASQIQPKDYVYSFPHQNRDVSFEYAATSYDYPEKIRFSYMLEGYDEDWSLWTNEAKKEYTSLWEGDYTFRVRSKNVYGTIGNEGVYQFSVLPPFYRTWWAYTLAALMFASLIFTYTRYRINRHKKALEKQQLLNEKLQHADQLKDTFLANTSHELRTPLTGIIGLAEALKDGSAGDLDEKVKADLSLIVGSGKRLSSLVNSILDFSKLKTHDIELALRPVDVRSITQVVLKMSEPLISGKDLVLKNEIPADTPPVMADEDRLQQILHNLVGNAIKFTETGYVAVSAIQEGDMLALKVTDTGAGIPEEKIDLIFKEFEQADNSNTREFVGTGLGLSITKKLVELHG